MLMSLLKDSQYNSGRLGMLTDRLLGSILGGGGGGALSNMLDSEGFAVYSNVKFLYLIGKIASETGEMPEDGLNALGDYLNIVEYFREDFPEEAYEKLVLKTQFCIGMIFYRLRDKE
jgi:hypothetical protein